MSDFVAAKYILDNMKNGIAPDNVEAINVMAMDGGAKIRVRPPKDTVIDNQLICTVKGYRLLIKEGAAPKTEDDGTLIEEVTQLDKYKANALLHSGLVNGTT